MKACAHKTLLAGLLLLLSTASYADRVVFKNGRTLDCKIVKETPGHVVVSLGSGSMSIPRKQVARLERSGLEQTEPQQAVSSNRNILSEQHAPKAHADLAAAFRTLMKRRNEAYDANYMLNLYDRDKQKQEKRAEQLNREISQLGLELAQISSKIEAIKLPEQTPRSSHDIRAYNDMIRKKTLLTDQWHALHARIVPLEEQYNTALMASTANESKRPAAQQTIMLYHKELAAFSPRFAERAAKLKTDDPDTQELYSKIARYLDRFKGEVSTTHLESTQVGNSTLVQALVNGTTLGRFIFDTGATSMVLSESFAKRLGIQSSTLPKSEMIIADGSRVEVRSTTLRSVEAGDAKVRDVHAIIVPDSPNNPEDGLLGMSFLRHFSISFSGGKIELTRFQPEN